MNEKPRKFRRVDPDLRRETLIDAALRCLEREGHDGLSVRKIAAEAGVSVGLINHHYRSIDLLIAHAYESLADSIMASVIATVDQAEATPRARLTAFFRASFSPPMLDPALLGVWVVFWSMIRHSAAMQSVHDRIYLDYRARLEADLVALAETEGLPQGACRLIATGLAALLDGAWLEWCLNPDNFSPEDGVALCESWVDGFVATGFPRLAPP